MEQSELLLELKKVDALIKKEFDKDTVKDADDDSLGSDTLSTGSLNIDLALKHPIPIGIHEIAGGHGAGKSTLALHMCENAQKKGWPVYYIDLERGLNKESLKRFKNLDPSLLKVVEPMNAEEATDIALLILKNTNNALIIYDSVAASLATEANMAKSMSDKNMGIVAKLMSNFLSKAIPYVKKSRSRLILINQKRDNLSMYGGRPTPGGNPVEHYTTQRIFLTSTKSNVIEIKTSRGSKVVGKSVYVEIVKNRWTSPADNTEMKIKFDIGVWRDLELVNVALDFGLLSKSAAWIKYGDDFKAQGDVKFMQKLNENPEIKEKLEFEIRDLLGVHEIQDDSGEGDSD